MSDKFSFYQTEGLWGIIENASDEKQTSIKSYFGSDLIIKRLNEQADQIDQLKQQLAELKEKYNKASEKLKNITEEVENNFVHGQDYEKLKQELAELKEKAIVPKFKVGQKIWYIDRYGIQKDTIISFTYFSIQNEILYKMSDEIIDYREEYIFATEQEAQEKLKEIQGNE